MLFQSIGTSGSALTAERLRMDVISNNLANMDSTVTPGGNGPYQREVVFLAARGTVDGVGTGVQVTAVTPDQSPPKEVYDPGNPQANTQGYVAYPNVNPVREMVDLMDAVRAYEANVTTMGDAKTVDTQTMSIMRA